jgi:hypothetical protein
VVDADHTANAEKRAFEHGLCGHPLHTALTSLVSRFRQSRNGQNRPHQRQEQILRQWRHPAYEIYHKRLSSES